MTTAATTAKSAADARSAMRTPGDVFCIGVVVVAAFCTGGAAGGANAASAATARVRAAAGCAPASAASPCGRLPLEHSNMCVWHSTVT